MQPIVSIVLYYGEKPWDGALALHEMLSFPENVPGISSAVNNNHIILLDVRRYTGAEKFKTDLKETFTFIRYSSDKEKLKEYVEANEEVFGNLQEDAYDFLAFTTGSGEIMKVKEKTKTKAGGHNMCKAIQGMIDDGIAEGIQRGLQQGIEQGIEQGIQRGQNMGEERIARLNLQLMNEGRLDDLRKVLEDTDYRKKLMQEYHI